MQPVTAIFSSSKLCKMTSRGSNNQKRNPLLLSFV